MFMYKHELLCMLAGGHCLCVGEHDKSVYLMYLGLKWAGTCVICDWGLLHYGMFCFVLVLR